MLSFRRSNPALHRVVEPQVFREAMNRPAIARDLFLPMDQAWWDGGRFTLGRWASMAPRPEVRGVRLQEPRPESNGPAPELDTQRDLCTLVRSVTELRRLPQMAGMVLSEEILVGEQKGATRGKRVLFGLTCPADGRFDGETPAVAECHRVLRRAVDRAGFVVEHPKQPFNPLTGFDGLNNWVASTRLRKKRSRRPWLLLLLLPLLFFPIECLRNWYNSRGNVPSGKPSELAKSSQNVGESDKGEGGAGAGKAPGGPGGSGGGAGSGGEPRGKPGSENNGGKPKPPTTQSGTRVRQPPWMRTAEESGPRTTIPSKLAGAPVPPARPFLPRLPGLTTSRSGTD